MKKVFAICILLMLGFLACITRNPIPLTRYNSWIVVQKPHSNPIGSDGYVEYSVKIQKNDIIKKIWTSEYYYKMYEVGDTIKIHY